MSTISGQDNIELTQLYLFAVKREGALIVYLPTILGGRESWMKDSTIQRAINIDDGVVKKESVLTFQNRMPNYPHNFIKS